MNKRDEILEAKIAAAKTFGRARNFTEAIRECTEIIELAPNYDKAYFVRGIVYACLKQYETAIQDFDKAIELNPNYDEAYRNHELCFERLSEQDEASVDENIPPYVRQVREQNIRDHSRALKLNPNDAMTYNNRGAEYAALGKNRAALRDYNRAIRLAPNKSMLHKNRALTYKRLKQYDEAIQDLSKALALNPNDAFAYNERGSIYFELEKYEQAIQDFDKVIEFKDFYEPDAYRRRGNAYLNLSNMNGRLGIITKPSRLIWLTRSLILIAHIVGRSLEMRQKLKPP